MSTPEIILPFPPSANTLYRTIIRGKRAIPIKSKEHRQFFQAVVASTAGVQQWAEEKALEVWLYLYRPRRVGDVDGPIKACLDSLNGIAWADDSQIVALHVIRGDDKYRPRVEVLVREVTP